MEILLTCTGALLRLLQGRCMLWDRGEQREPCFQTWAVHGLALGPLCMSQPCRQPLPLLWARRSWQPCLPVQCLLPA